MQTFVPFCPSKRFVALLLPALAWVASLAAATPRHLFLDPAILAAADDAELNVNPARRRETVISPDRPWEKHMISFFLTVRDEGAKLRMWYVCRDDWGEGSQANLAYAESTDGVHWTKPDLGVYEYKGSRANNLVGVHSLEGVVFQDPNMPPDQRYLYVSTGKAESGDKSTPAVTSIYRHSSPDGRRWKRDPQPLIDAASDTQNVTWWDDHWKEYVVIVRGWTRNGLRKVNRLALPSLTVPATVKPDGSGRGRYFHNEIPTFLRRWSNNDVRRQKGMKTSVGPSGTFRARPESRKRSWTTEAQSTQSGNIPNQLPSDLPAG